MKKLIFNYFVGCILLFFIGCKSEKNISEQYINENLKNMEGKPFIKRGKRPVFAEILSKLDTNNDQKISTQEVKGPLKFRFNIIDSNKDGFITETEFKNAPPPPPPPIDEHRKPPLKKIPSF
jgi:Ca2+-binding EF-hand superfamily protein